MAATVRSPSLLVRTLYLQANSATYRCRYLGEILWKTPITPRLIRLKKLSMVLLWRLSPFAISGASPGHSYFCTPLDACDMIEDADEKGAYLVESVWMTPRQFDAIPEFMGF